MHRRTLALVWSFPSEPLCCTNCVPKLLTVQAHLRIGSALGKRSLQSLKPTLLLKPQLGTPIQKTRGYGHFSGPTSSWHEHFCWPNSWLHVCTPTSTIHSWSKGGWVLSRLRNTFFQKLCINCWHLVRNRLQLSTLHIQGLSIYVLPRETNWHLPMRFYLGLQRKINPEQQCFVIWKPVTKMPMFIAQGTISGKRAKPDRV